MSEEQDSQGDLPTSREKGEESYPESPTKEPSQNDPEPETLPTTHEEQEGVYAD